MTPPTATAAASPVSAAAHALERLRRSRAALPLALGAALWFAYAVGGLRPPWAAIVVSDADAGGARRQLLFTAIAAAAGYAVLRASALTALCSARRGLFVALALVLGSALASEAPATSLKRGVLLAFACLTLAACLHASAAPLRTFQRVALGVATAAGGASLLAFAALPAACWSIAERPGLAGVTSHPNTLAPIMAIGLLISLGVSPQGALGRRRLWAARAVMIAALALARSVTSWALLGAGVGLWWYLRASPARRGRLQVTVAAALVFAGGAAQLLSADELLGAVGRDPSLSGRDVLWGRVLAAGFEQPLFGRGFGAFWVEGRGRDLVGTWNPRQSHNAYLDLFLDLGLAGLLAGAAAAGAAAQRGWRLLARAPCGSPARSAIASLLALGGALLGIYGWGESFLLKADKLAFLVLLWAALLLTNRDANGLTRELGLSECGGARAASQAARLAPRAGGT